MDTSLRIAVNVANKQALEALRVVEARIKLIRTTATKTAATLGAVTKAQKSTTRAVQAFQKQIAQTRQQSAGIDDRFDRANALRDQYRAESALRAKAEAEERASLTRRAEAVRASLAEQRAARVQSANEERAIRARAISDERNALGAEHALRMAHFRQVLAASQAESAQRVSDSATTRAAIQRDLIAVRATYEKISNDIERNSLMSDSGSSRNIIRGLTSIATTAKNVTSPALRGIGTAFSTSATSIGRAAAATRARIAALGASLRGLSGGLLEAGRQSQWLGRQIEFRIGLPILAATAASVKFAKDTNAAWTQVVKVYNGATGELDHLRKSVRLMSDELGIHQEEVIGVMQVWAQTGRVGIDLAKVTDLTMRAAVLGNLDYQESAQGLIVIQDAFQLSTKELDTVLAKLNLTENQTKANTEDLIEVFRKAGAQANVAGVDVEELAGMTAALVKGFGTASEIGTSLNTLMRNWSRLTPQMAKGFKAIGIDVQDATWRTASFTDQLRQVADATKGLSPDAMREITAVLGQRHSNKLIGLLNDINSETGRLAFTVDELTRNYSDLSAEELKVVKSNSEMAAQLKRTGSITAEMYADVARQVEFSRALNSESAVFDRQVNRLRNMAIEIGTALLPVVNELVGAVLRLANAFRNLDPAYKKLIGFSVLAVAAIGPLMGIFGSVAILIGSVTSAATFLAATLGKVLLGPIALIGSAFASAMAAGSAFLSTIGAAASAITSGFAASVGALGAALSKSVFLRIASVGASLGKFATILKVFGAAIPVALVGLKAAFAAALVGAIAYGVTAAINTLRILWSRAQAFLEQQISRLPATMQPALQALLRLVTSIGGLIADGLLFIPRLIARGFTDGVELTATTLGQLPGVVANAFVTVVEVVKRAALAIYQWFSWINPFARHSPSLVENVQNGTQVISDSFREMARNASVMGDLESPLHGFLNFVERLEDAQSSLERSENRFLIGEINPGLLPAYDQALERIDAMVAQQQAAAAQISVTEAELESLRSTLESIEFDIDVRESALEQLTDQAQTLEAAISDAQQQVQDLAGTSLIGQAASGDRIFNLSTERKEIELEMARIERAFDINVRESVLASLTAEAESLESAIDDASSAIDRLSSMSIAGESAADDEIFQLQLESKQVELEIAKIERAFQNSSMSDSARREIDNLNDILEALELDLEIAELGRDIDFEPLRREIDQLVDPIQEMSFDDIVMGISAEQSVIDALEGERSAVLATMSSNEAAVASFRSEMESLEQTLADIDLDLKIEELTADLQFEPLRREIKQLAAPIEEMSFDDIVSGIKEAQSTTSALEIEQLAVLDAIEAQESALDLVRADHEAISTQIATQESLLSDLNAGYSSITSELDEANSKMDSFVNSLRSAVESVADLSGAGAGAAAGTGLLSDFTPGDFETPAGLDLAGLSNTDAEWESYFDQHEDSMQKALSGSNIKQRLKDWWDGVWADINFDPDSVDWGAVSALQERGFGPNAAGAELGLGDAAKVKIAEFYDTGEVPETSEFMGRLQELRKWWEVNSPQITKRIEEFREKVEEWRVNVAEAADYVLQKFKDFRNSPTVDNIISGFTKMSEAAGGTKRLLSALGLIVAGLALYFGGPLAIIAGVVALFVALEAKTGLVSAAFELLAPIIGWALGYIHDVFDAAVNVIGGIVEIVRHIANGEWGQAWGVFVSILGDAFVLITAFLAPARLAKLFGPLAKGLIKVVQKAGKWFKSTGWPLLKAGFKKIGTWLANNKGSIWGGIQTGFSWAWEAMKAVFVTLWTALKATLKKIGTWIYDNRSAIWNTLKTAFEWGWAALKTAFTTLWTAFKATLKTIGTWIWNNRSGIWNALKTAFEWGWAALKTVYGTLWSAFKETLKKVGAWIYNNRGLIWGKLKDGLSAAWDVLRGWITGTMIPKIIELAKGIGTKLLSESGAIWGGLRTGLYDAIFGTNGLLDAIPGWASRIASALAGAFAGLAANIYDAIFGGAQDAVNDAANISASTPARQVGTPSVARQVGTPSSSSSSSSGTLRPGSMVAMERGGLIPTAQWGMVRSRHLGSGFKASSPRAIVGEGRGSYNEYAITTDPRFKRRSLHLYYELGRELGVGHPPRAMTTSVSNTNVMPVSPNGGNTTIHLHGDLVLPNISDGDDAQDFLDNLEALAG